MESAPTNDKKQRPRLPIKTNVSAFLTYVETISVCEADTIIPLSTFNFPNSKTQLSTLQTKSKHFLAKLCAALGGEICRSNVEYSSCTRLTLS